MKEQKTVRQEGLPSTVSPQKAHQLMLDGALYLDVRTSEEFEAGHPLGAINVPLSFRRQGALVPNEAFVSQVRARVVSSRPLVVGCRSGGRSGRAVSMLLAEGFEWLFDCSAGFEGQRDPFGRMVLAGWSAEDLPCSYGPE